MAYRPTPNVEKILNLAKREADAVPYGVSTRWVFYQAVQTYGVEKDLYRKFLKWTSRARKAFWNGWSPDTFTDDNREITERGDGDPDEGTWVRGQIDNQCLISVQARQANILTVLFEAAAMRSQFDYYLEPLRIPSAPFRGDASIRQKWEIAKRLERLHEEFPDKGIVVLYFGDLDPKGLEIPVNALKDIWKWMIHDDLGTTLAEGKDEGYFANGDGTFRWIRVGLNDEQVDRLDVEDNPEKPGTYQWEALSDEDAGELIREAVRPYWDANIVRDVEREEAMAEARWRDLLRGALEDEQT